MKKYLTALSLFCISFVSADTVIWNGDIDSSGAPSPTIKLELGKKYQVKATGTMSLGTWYKNGLPLKNDACFEFNDTSHPHLSPSFKSSMNVTVCDGKYNDDHSYTSKPFIAAQNAIHFWVYDTDYQDNKGSLHVELIKLEQQYD